MNAKWTAFICNERERERAFMTDERERERERGPMNVNVNANVTFPWTTHALVISAYFKMFSEQNES